VTIGTVAVNAGPLFQSTNGLFIMAGSVYIHEVTPQIARQWIRVLEPLAEEEQ
jgi:hypothetical protein